MQNFSCHYLIFVKKGFSLFIYANKLAAALHVFLHHLDHGQDGGNAARGLQAAIDEGESCRTDLMSQLVETERQLKNDKESFQGIINQLRGASIEVIPNDGIYKPMTVRVRINGKTVDDLGGLPRTDTECDVVVCSPY